MKTEKSLSIENDPDLEELQRQNILLQHEVVDLKAQVSSTNEEMESMLYSISHDLRAPLRAIDGYSRILEQDYASTLDEEGLRLLNIVRSSTKNMDDMITNLLSLSRAGRSELKFQCIDMKNMVASIIQELSTPKIKEKFTFIVKDLPDCYGDQVLLRQVWFNLISNAMKFSMPKEKPEIIISGTDSKPFFTYTIKDNGVGFNPLLKGKLFGLFQRLHKVSEFEGTGVGLAVVQKIIIRHGGKVWGDSQPGEGAEFSFSFPDQRQPGE